jgi:pimeloyl-ACP methyl ester carboxylesterase
MCVTSERQETDSMTPQQHRVALASGEIDYFIAGEGRPLLFLHPAGGVRWTHVHEALARTHRLYLPVMPGFDGSPTHPGLDSMQGLGTLAGQFIDTVIGSACDVVGTSFGGWQSLWLTVQRPERVGQLVLVGPAGFRPPGVGGAPADPEALRRALYAHPEKLPPSSKTVEMEVANGRMRGHYNAARAMDEDLLARLGEIACPTLILHGTEDKVIPKESVQLLKTRIAGAFLIYLWDAAHAPEVDQPERMASVIGSFLERGEAFVANWGTLAVNPG